MLEKERPKNIILVIFRVSTKTKNFLRPFLIYLLLYSKQTWIQRKILDLIKLKGFLQDLTDRAWKGIMEKASLKNK